MRRIGKWFTKSTYLQKTEELTQECICRESELCQGRECGECNTEFGIGQIHVLTNIDFLELGMSRHELTPILLKIETAHVI